MGRDFSKGCQRGCKTCRDGKAQAIPLVVDILNVSQSSNPQARAVGDRLSKITLTNADTAEH